MSYAVGAPTNTMAIVSFVFGIASYVVCPVVGGIVAVITGHMARGQIRRTGESGNGFAIAGLVLGYIHLVLAVITIVILVIVFVIVGAAAIQNGSH